MPKTRKKPKKGRKPDLPMPEDPRLLAEAMFKVADKRMKPPPDTPRDPKSNSEK